ncbi:tRNA pseudouridine(13) synthase TruD [Candidatus Woesearchaeota archaeon]|jgi:tRNA pseudouridine13 synthase|nr:tRNA pseudouridine(13) synthase TruD [Candidatus Woesearchaeota archaeon]MBT5215746.1 tRNA pseudouridine(13) synthase TruD [Candidatus Woesearchaeota archaeon]MBT6402583.1 tRNA pseudouridine(13) synthase TruD [Candidatus Woesearchaeota archaeon]
MKIKQIPEDFLVEEIPTVKPKKTGPYAILELKKKDMDLINAKKAIAKKLRISYKEISHAGIKDKIAVTTQLISIKTNRKDTMNFQTPTISIKKIGCLPKPLQSGDLRGNKFTITLRDLTKDDIKKIKSNLKRINSTGIPNFFDSQRFGEDLRREGFIAKRLMKDDYETALKLYLTSNNNKSPNKNAAHRFIFKNWNKWMKCLTHLQKYEKLHEEKKIIYYLAKNPTHYLQSFRRINKLTQEIVVSAYQSFIWNKCLSVILKEKAEDLIPVDYAAGKLHFYKKLSNKQFEELRDLELPMIAPGTKITDEYIKSVVEKILSKEGIKQEELKVKKMGNLFFKTRIRHMIILPKDLKVHPEEFDDLNEGMNKLTIEFALEKGSYATMLLKALEL